MPCKPHGVLVSSSAALLCCLPRYHRHHPRSSSPSLAPPRRHHSFASSAAVYFRSVCSVPFNFAFFCFCISAFLLSSSSHSVCLSVRHYSQLPHLPLFYSPLLLQLLFPLFLFAFCVASISSFPPHSFSFSSNNKLCVIAYSPPLHSRDTLLLFVRLRLNRNSNCPISLAAPLWRLCTACVV